MNIVLTLVVLMAADENTGASQQIVAQQEGLQSCELLRSMKSLIRCCQAGSSDELLVSQPA